MTESFPDRICLRNPGCVQELAEKPVSSGALESRTALHCFAFLCSAGLEQPWRAARWVETGSRPNPPTEAGADSLLPILTILGKVTWYSKYQLTLFTKKLVEIAQMVKPLSFQNWIFHKKQLRHQHCTMCILGSTMPLWSKAEIQKYTFWWEKNIFEAIFPMLF